MQGILNVNKPAGMTSHDVVAYVRKQFMTRRVGHTGTLDPDAQGVLPVLIGGATKLADMLSAEQKAYRARVLLGVATDTYDTSGTVTQRKEVHVTEEEINRTLSGFLGRQTQIPPMYSAVKVGGQKLYRLARRGVEVERPAREITVDRLECVDFDLANDRFSIEVECSKGTYIRSLCHDIGERLGCGACMDGLVRLRSGRFSIEASHTLEEIAEAVKDARSEQLLISVDEALAEYPAINVSAANAAKIRNGLRLRLEQLAIASAHEGEMFRIYDADGLLCLGCVAMDAQGTEVMKLEKTFFGQ